MSNNMKSQWHFNAMTKIKLYLEILRTADLPEWENMSPAMFKSMPFLGVELGVMVLPIGIAVELIAMFSVLPLISTGIEAVGLALAISLPVAILACSSVTGLLHLINAYRIYSQEVQAKSQLDTAKLGGYFPLSTSELEPSSQPPAVVSAMDDGSNSFKALDDQPWLTMPVTTA